MIHIRSRSPATAVETFSVAEWEIDPGLSYANPFDPDQIAIDVAFTGPHGLRFVVPAFWSADCRVETDAAGGEHWSVVGAGRWLARTSFPVPGDWRIHVSATDKSGSRSSEPLQIEVRDSKRDGFIRLAPHSPRYLQYDSGKPYFAVGLNVAWAGQGGTTDFERWFTQLKASGGNFARVWMWRNNRVIENELTGPGRYDLADCAYYDRILKLAGDREIACMVTLGNHSQLLDKTYWGGGGWPVDAYNAFNGGPATRPANYFDPGVARTLYKRRLRYLVARYSAYTSLMAWELWNEQDVSGIDIPLDWTKEMAGYLHEIDPYHHPVTTSFANNGDAATWSLPEINFTQTHLYGDEGSVQDTVAAYSHAAASDRTHGKPWLLSEFGISWRNNDTKFDPTRSGTNLHNGLWAGMMLGGLGGGCTWWWDNYVEPSKLWPVFTGISRFAAEIDWPRRAFEPVAVRWPLLPATTRATYSDVSLPATAGWGRSAAQPFTLSVEGELSGSLPRFLYGPQKQSMRVPTSIQADFPRRCQLIVKVKKVSVESLLRVTIDNEPAADFNFDAKPGSRHQISTTQDSIHHNWVADFDSQCVVDIAAGPHTITLDNAAGDWMEIDSIDVTAFRSSLISNVRPMALQDATTGETLVWLQDIASNWYEDSRSKPPANWSGLTVAVPVAHSGLYRVDWWDTRASRIIQRDRIDAEAGTLNASVPGFVRDVAARVWWQPKETP